ncbi:MAG: DnaJ C-terminal domain-containing protein, partial [Candidatus Syntropharchaeia archaeon]
RFGPDGFDWDHFTHFRDLDEIFGDFFGDFFGKRDSVFGDFFRERRRSWEKGENLVYNLEITLKEAAFGTEREIQIPKVEVCRRCNGSRAEPGYAPVTCPTCSGTGEVKHVRSMGFSRFITIGRCDTCNGSGKIIDAPCSGCNGRGTVRIKKKISINIPPGVDTGTKLRIQSEGNPGKNGGPPGDLYVVINVKPDEIFEREGNDVICEVPIDFVQAALGDEIVVPTLNGEKVTVKIPPGTQTDTVFTLKGKGIPNLNGRGRGDQHVRVRIVIPTNLSERQKELLREFAKESGESGKKGFFERIIDDIKEVI